MENKKQRDKEEIMEVWGNRGEGTVTV